MPLSVREKHHSNRSAVSLGDQRTSLIISQNWSDFPIKTFRPLSSVLITSICVISFNQDPTLN